MEPVPNAPLPWKGVFLILLPGLVYLVSQVAQLITGETWYYVVYYRVTFLLIAPVLIAWVFARRFPLWGLIPLGLLYRVVQEIGYQLIVWHPQAFSGNTFLKLILDFARQIEKNRWILIIPLAILTLFLAWRYIRQQKPSHSFWLWLGIYLLVASIEIVQDYGSFVQFIGENPQSIAVNAQMLRTWFSYTGQWSLYNLTALLLLVFIGTLFTRRHGFFTILILVGYIMPATLVGSWNFDEFSNPTMALIVLSTAILAYRSLLSFIAPIWISRTSSQTGKKRVVLVSIVVALCIHAVMQFYPAMLYPEPYRITSQWLFPVIFEELKLISIICLGTVMYQNISPAANSPENIPTKYSGLSPEKT